MDWLVDDDLLTLHKWHRVTGGGLPFPVLIRIGKARDERPFVSGLIVGDGEPVEVTPDTLRTIRIGAILAQLFEGFDPTRPPRWEADLADQVAWGLMYEQVWRPAPVVDAGAGRGPTDGDLQRFAQVYQRERVRNPRRAMAATAEALNISVATAHRRATLCRERRYLPPK
ncbi:hypothetical protein Prum_053520 [Phytohabitans rumicis]|uniref:Uncharacterized protein n=2 Tax=Phytohabitans rumicis TaxID=1076125 RepID=A0A6V8L836_9ACTN|nr:hypothetical protein Prum_053520 [Phytohabitans rumicis]